MKFLFRRVGQPDESYPLKIVDGHVQQADPELEPYFLLALRRTGIFLDRAHYAGSLKVGGVEVEAQTRLSLWGQIEGDQGTLNLRDWLLYDRNRQAQFHMQGAHRQFSIGNQYECDIQIEDELDQTWTCILDSTDNGYLFRPESCPIRYG